RLHHGIEAHAGVQHEVIKTVIGPFAIVETAHIRGTPSVGCQNFLLGFFRMLRKVLREPFQFALHGSMHKDVENSWSSKQGAGGSASDDHTVARLHLLLQVVADELNHARRVEEFRIDWGGQPLNRSVPESLAKTVIPGIKALVTALRELFCDS